MLSHAETNEEVCVWSSKVLDTLLKNLGLENSPSRANIVINIFYMLPVYYAKQKPFWSMCICKQKHLSMVRFESEPLIQNDDKHSHGKIKEVPTSLPI
jgi:hypothetical protein